MLVWLKNEHIHFRDGMFYMSIYLPNVLALKYVTRVNFREGLLYFDAVNSDGVVCGITVAIGEACKTLGVSLKRYFNMSTDYHILHKQLSMFHINEDYDINGLPAICFTLLADTTKKAYILKEDLSHVYITNIDNFAILEHILEVANEFNACGSTVQIEE